MHKSCVVVGAGAAGLSVSRALVDAGVEHVVLERNSVADTWARQRWDSFRLNTPGWMNTVLGPVEPDSFSTRDEVVQLLSDLAGSLPVQPHTPVLALERGGSTFVLRTPAREITATTVVLASGLQNVPKMPGYRERLSPRLRQLHAAHYKNAEQLGDGAVLIAGSGQSGSQIAEDLAHSGRQVYLATSRVGRYPWMYRGRELLGWLVDCGHWDQRPQDLADPGETRAATAVVGSGGHSLDLPTLARLGVRLLGRLQAADGERVTFAGSVQDNMAYADTVAATLQAKADCYIRQQAIEAPDPEPVCAVAASAASAVTELDLAAHGVTSVIWSTGFTGDLSWVRAPILDGHGHLRHQRCACAVPGIWCIGFPWLTRRSSGILHGLPADAAEVANDVRRYLERKK